VLGAAAVLLAACTGGTGSAGTPRPTPTSTSTSTVAPSSTVSTATATASASTPSRTRRVDKLLVVVVENHSLAQMRAQMPLTDALAKRYGQATAYRAATHPSLPNYLAIASGSTQGVTDDRPPAAHPVQGSSVFGAALASGGTAAVYADGMPQACWQRNAGTYAVRHNPWTYFTGERSSCAAHDLPITALEPAIAAGSLPTAGMLVPDTCHDAHDCPLAVADQWFAGWATRIMAGPDWRSGRLAVVLTADEDDDHSGNVVLTVVLHPSLHGRVVTTALTHYSLARLYAEVAGTTPLGGARTAPSMAAAFGLPVAAG
jgi:acid phosphatase